MSYCRFIECDVYAYDSCEGGVQFYVARSVGEDLDRLCPTYNEAYQYAKTLRDKHGADIPDHAIDALRADALEEAERISGPGSAVAELRDENARLRELMYDRAHVHAIQHMTEDELRITAANVMEENRKLRELCEDCAIELYANGNVTDAATENLFDDMRKLGIKVGR